jgi:geranylgeranyl diphosphate synthase, type II
MKRRSAALVQREAVRATPDSRMSRMAGRRNEIAGRPMTRIERSLLLALRLADSAEAPPLLTAAMRYAVFPGGARIRPRLCMAVARACGEDKPLLTAGVAASIEILHCASLVHDDLPCFDDAAKRRGRPSVHTAFGERIGILTGDALIVLAMQALAHAAEITPSRLGPLILVLSRAVGAPNGIIAGQGWECEPSVSLAKYQQAKTGALFAAATAAGACAAGHDAGAWHLLGARIGEAYQIADDIRDVFSDEQALGKPTGRDQALYRPNAVNRMGLDAAVDRLQELVRSAIEAIPNCHGAHELRAHILAEASRLLPRELARPAA